MKKHRMVILNMLISRCLTCSFNQALRGLPLSMYAPRGVGGVKPPIHFHCVLHAKRGWVGPDSM